jgi:hypothetical protein
MVLNTCCPRMVVWVANDLLIHPANGHKIQEADVAKVNDELRSLLSKVIALSKKLYAEEANTSRRA